MAAFLNSRAVIGLCGTPGSRQETVKAGRSDRAAMDLGIICQQLAEMVKADRANWQQSISVPFTGSQTVNLLE